MEFELRHPAYHRAHKFELVKDGYIADKNNIVKDVWIVTS